MSTPQEVRAAISRVANMVLNGELEAKNANAILYAANITLGAIRADEQQKKLEELKPKAIELFKDAYGKTPKEAGFPVIGLYEKQSAYLYATSETVIKSYKTQQNIIRWLMLWYLWPLPVAFCGTTMTMIKYTSFTHPSFIAWCFFTAFWAILGFILMGRALLASRSAKFGKNVTYLNY